MLIFHVTRMRALQFNPIQSLLANLEVPEPSVMLHQIPSPERRGLGVPGDASSPMNSHVKPE